MSEEVKEEIQEEAVEAEAQMTPEEAVAAVETAAKSFIDMVAKANETLKGVAEVGDKNLGGLQADVQQAAQAIGVTVDKLSGTAKEIMGVFMPQEAADEAEAAQEAAPAEEE